MVLHPGGSYWPSRHKVYPKAPWNSASLGIRFTGICPCGHNFHRHDISPLSASSNKSQVRSGSGCSPQDEAQAVTHHKACSEGPCVLTQHNRPQATPTHTGHHGSETVLGDQAPWAGVGEGGPSSSSRPPPLPKMPPRRRSSSPELLVS